MVICTARESDLVPFGDIDRNAADAAMGETDGSDHTAHQVSRSPVRQNPSFVFGLNVECDCCGMVSMTVLVGLVPRNERGSKRTCATVLLVPLVGVPDGFEAHGELTPEHLVDHHCIPFACLFQVGKSTVADISNNIVHNFS